MFSHKPWFTIQPNPMSINAASMIDIAISTRESAVVTAASYEQSLVCQGLYETLAMIIAPPASPSRPLSSSEGAEG
jgi:hypothetical protein